jgi:hypothetical protein
MLLRSLSPRSFSAMAYGLMDSLIASMGAGRSPAFLCFKFAADFFAFFKRFDLHRSV